MGRTGYRCRARGTPTISGPVRCVRHTAPLVSIMDSLMMVSAGVAGLTVDAEPLGTWLQRTPRPSTAKDAVHRIGGHQIPPLVAAARVHP